MDKYLVQLNEELEAAKRRHHKIKIKFFTEMIEKYQNGGKERVLTLIELKQSSIRGADPSVYELMEAINATRKIMKS